MKNDHGSPLRRLLRICVCPLLFIASAVCAQPGMIDTTFGPAGPFNVGEGTNAPVLATVIQPDGRLILAGNFTMYKGIPVPRIIRLDPDGSLDPSFQPGLGPDNTVQAVLLQPDGKLVIGGWFTTYNGTSMARFARLEADGSLDPGFNIGAGANAPVYSLALQPDGKLILGGMFSWVDGHPHTRFARIHSNGSVDATFNNSQNTDGIVHSIALQADGKILLGGSFTTVQDVIKVRIARLHSTGELDTTFTATAPGTVHCVLTTSSGKIYLGGSFLEVNGVFRPRLARLNDNGSLDTAFIPDNAIISTRVRTLVEHPDGKLFIGGLLDYFTNGTTFRHTALLHADGELDTSFLPMLPTMENIGEVYAMALQQDGRVVLAGDLVNIIPGIPDHLFRLNPDGTTDAAGGGANAPVQAILVQPDGKVVVGGGFSTFMGYPHGSIVRLNADKSLDTGFDAGAGCNGAVNALVLQPDGKLLIAGDFSSVDGVPRERLARLLPDGSLDMAFDPGSGANGSVDAMVLQPNGRIVIGGAFTMYNGAQRNGVARLLANGAVDGSFQIGNGFTGLDGRVLALALQEDGRLVVGGSFDTVAGQARSNLARLNQDGSLDLGFPATMGPNQAVRAIAIHPTGTPGDLPGRIVIGGEFWTYGQAIPRNRIARLMPDGSLDFSFNAGIGPGPIMQGLPFPYLRSIAILPSGKLIVAGEFTQFAGGTSVFVRHVARLNRNGSVDTLFNLPLNVGGANALVRTLALQDDGKVILGGDFTTYNDTAASRIVRVLGDACPLVNAGIGQPCDDGDPCTADDTVDAACDCQGVPVVDTDGDGVCDAVDNCPTTPNPLQNTLWYWDQDGDGVGTQGVATCTPPADHVAIGGDECNVDPFKLLPGACGCGQIDGVVLDTAFAVNGADGTVLSMALQPDGKILIGGIFNNYGGTQARRVARLNADGTRDPGFAPVIGPNNIVRVVLPQEDLKVLMFGDFTTVDGVARNRVARLHPDGGLDQAFAPGSGANNSVRTAVVQANGRIMIGGDFTSFNGVGRNRIARLYTDGSLDPTFVPGTGANGPVNTIVLLDDGRIMIAGEFTSYNGVPCNRIARLHPDGSLDSTFDVGTGANAAVHAIALQPDGKVLVGGDLTSFNGVATAYIVRLKPNGSLDLAFDGGSGANGTIRTLALQPDGKILAGGGFTSFQGLSRDRLVRLERDGSVDTSFDPGAGANLTVLSVKQRADGSVVIAGQFFQVNGMDRGHIAAFRPDCYTLAVAIEGPSSVCSSGSITLTATPLNGVPPFTYLWNNGSTSNSITVSADGGYWVQVWNQHGGPAFAERIITLELADTWYADADGDGAGDPAASVMACVQPVGYVANGTDQCDNDPLKTMPGNCGCGVPEGDSDGDGLCDAVDECPLVAGQIGSACDDGDPCTQNDVLNANCQCAGSYVAMAVTIQADGPFAICPGASVNLASSILGGCAPYALTWYNGAAPIGNDSVLVAEAEGAYSVVVTDSEGLTAVSDTLSVVWLPSPMVSIQAGSGIHCQNGVGLTLSATGASTYAWSPAIGLNATSGGTVLAAPEASTTYTVTGVDANGCIGMDSVLVASVAPPVIAAVTASTESLCPGGTVQLQVGVDPVAPPAYCQTGYWLGTGFGDWCSLVSIPGTTLNNPSGRSTSTPYYTLYPPVGHTTATLRAGESYSLVLQAGTYASNQFAAWVDYDGDGVFQEPQELLGTLSNLGPSPAQGTIIFTVPVWARNGPARLRVREADPTASVVTPCGTLSLGEVEDYTLNIVSPNCGTEHEFSWAPAAYLSDAATCAPTLNGLSSDTMFTVTVTNAAGCSATASVAVSLDANDTDQDGIPDCLDACPDLPGTGTNGTLDPLFASSAGANATVMKAALQPDGKVLLGGAFTAFDGQPHGRLVRLQPDGTLDAGFNVGSGANNTVQGLSVLPDGKLLVSGWFGSFNGLAVGHLVRLFPNGTIDPLFAGSTNSSVLAMDVQVDGRIVIGGLFTSASGASRIRVARLDPDGTLDPSFDPGSGPNGSVEVLVVQPDGKVIIAGQFTEVGGVARHRIARLHANGALDLSFDPGAGADDIIYALSLQPDGKVVAAGNFTSFDGIAQGRIVRLHADGGLDNTFNMGGTGASGQVHTIVNQPDGRMLIGGWLFSYNGNLVQRLARLYPDGSFDDSFDPGQGPDADVRTLVGQPDGTVVVAGSFTTYAGMSRGRVARLVQGDADGDGVADGDDACPCTPIAEQPETWYADLDSDGFGDPNTSVIACTQPPGHVANGNDCNDGDSQITQVGAPCDDGDAGTTNDVVTNDCQCVGTAIHVALAPRLLLEGPYDAVTGLMRDDLRVQGLIPGSEPYTMLGHTFVNGGGEQVDATVFAVAGSNAIVDWVVVELRDAVDPMMVVQGRAALLQRDGDVVDLDGVSPLSFNAGSGSYHVAVFHRNHLACMTASPQQLGTLPTVVDLTLANTASYGSNARKTMAGNPAVEVLWAGDVNYDGRLMYTGQDNDRDPVLSTIGGIVPTSTVSGYLNADVNMDGTVKYTGPENDRDPILQNIGGVVPTQVRMEQMP